MLRRCFLTGKLGQCLPPGEMYSEFVFAHKEEDVDFNVIRKDMQMFNFEVLRIDCDNFFEGVIVGQELDKLNGQLKCLLGDAVYPAKDKLAHKVSQAVEGLGGLLPGQTLYYKDSGADSIIAMLWPWKDGQRTTVKIIRQ